MQCLLLNRLLKKGKEYVFNNYIKLTMWIFSYKHLSICLAKVILYNYTLSLIFVSGLFCFQFDHPQYPIPFPHLLSLPELLHSIVVWFPWQPDFVFQSPPRDVLPWRQVQADLEHWLPSAAGCTAVGTVLCLYSNKLGRYYLVWQTLYTFALAKEKKRHLLIKDLCTTNLLFPIFSYQSSKKGSTEYLRFDRLGKIHYQFMNSNHTVFGNMRNLKYGAPSINKLAVIFKSNKHTKVDCSREWMKRNRIQVLCLQQKCYASCIWLKV